MNLFMLKLFQRTINLECCQARVRDCLLLVCSTTPATSGCEAGTCSNCYTCLLIWGLLLLCFWSQSLKVLIPNLALSPCLALSLPLPSPYARGRSLSICGVPEACLVVLSVLAYSLHEAWVSLLTTQSDTAFLSQPPK